MRLLLLVSVLLFLVPVIVYSEEITDTLVVNRVAYDASSGGQKHAMETAKMAIFIKALDKHCGRIVSIKSVQEYFKLQKMKISTNSSGSVKINPLSQLDEKNWNPRNGTVSLTAEIKIDCQKLSEEFVDGMLIKSCLETGVLSITVQKSGEVIIDDKSLGVLAQGRNEVYRYSIGKHTVIFKPKDGSEASTKPVFLRKGSEAHLNLGISNIDRIELTHTSNNLVYFSGDRVFPSGSDSNDTFAEEDEFYAPKSKLAGISPFAITRTEITNREYKEFIDSSRTNPNIKPPGCRDCDEYNWRGRNYPKDKADYPVTCITWEEAKAYCKWRGGHLPNEHEWEYACKGDSTSPFFWGNNSTDAHKYAWYSATSNGRLHPVRKKEKNHMGEGIFDMAGNAWEWVDLPNPNINKMLPLSINKEYKALEKHFDLAKGIKSQIKIGWKMLTALTKKSALGFFDKMNKNKPDYRIVRGGSFNYPVPELRSANREKLDKDGRYPDVGFRCVFRKKDFYNKAIVEKNSEYRIIYLLEETNINPEFGPVFYELGLVYQKKQIFQVALDYFKRAEELYISDFGDLYTKADALLKCSEIYHRLGNDEMYSVALSFCERVINNEESAVKLAQAYFISGKIFACRKDYIEALEVFNRAITIDKSLTDVIFQRGKVYVELDEPDSAINDFSTVLQRKPEYKYAHREKGIALYYNEDTKAAIDNLNIAIYQNPKDAKAFYFRGIIKILKNDTVAGLIDIDKCIMLDSGFAYPHFIETKDYTTEYDSEKPHLMLRETIEDSSHTDSIDFFVSDLYIRKYDTHANNDMSDEIKNEYVFIEQQIEKYTHEPESKIISQLDEIFSDENTQQLEKIAKKEKKHSSEFFRRFVVHRNNHGFTIAASAGAGIKTIKNIPTFNTNNYHRDLHFSLAAEINPSLGNGIGGIGLYSEFFIHQNHCDSNGIIAKPDEKDSIVSVEHTSWELPIMMNIRLSNFFAHWGVSLAGSFQTINMARKGTDDTTGESSIIENRYVDPVWIDPINLDIGYKFSIIKNAPADIDIEGSWGIRMGNHYNWSVAFVLNNSFFHTGIRYTNRYSDNQHSLSIIIGVNGRE